MLVVWVLSAFGLLVLLLMAAPMIEPSLVLAFGWVEFLRRTLSAMSWNWDLVGMGVLASAGILLLAQGLLGGLFDKVAMNRNLRYRWSWRWTCTGFVGMLLLFLVGMAAGGIAHQVGWLMATNQPMMKVKRGRWQDVADMRLLDGAILQMAGEIHMGNLREVRRSLESSVRDVSSTTPLLQSYQVLLVTTNGETVTGRLIFPRDGQMRGKVGGYFSFDSGGEGFCPWPVMREMIKTNGASLFAL